MTTNCANIKYPRYLSPGFLILMSTCFLQTSVAQNSSGHAPVSGSDPGDKPNIIMITAHDLGRHLGCYGVPSVQTPNIDALAQKGMMFTNFFSTSSVCTPGRGSLHTGRYPQSNGLMGLCHAPWWWKLHDDEKHTAEILHSQGYKSVLVGLNHVYTTTGEGHFEKEAKRLGYDLALSQETETEETVSESIKLIRAAHKDDKPVFMKIGFQEVHRVFRNGSDSTLGIFIPPYLANTSYIREDLAAFQATIAYFDACVGRILNELENSDISRNTVVILTADHGIPYIGAKWAIRKAGMEIPLIIYQPGTIFSGGKVEDALMSNIDLLPTLLDYLQLEIPDNIQGVSFMPFLNNETQTKPRKLIFGQYTPDMKRDNESRCVYDGRYWYIHYFDAGRSVVYPSRVHPQRFASHVERAPTHWGARPFFQLYDIETDPFCLHDIGSEPENKDIIDRLSGDLLEWMKSVDDPLLHGATKVPYYERSMDDLLDNESGISND